MMYEDLTHKIIGCAMEVHREMGSGFQEVIYQRSLAIEMRFQKLDFIRELSMTVSYKNEEVGTRRVDFFVADTIMVEMKAVAQLNDDHLAQAINYCEAYNLPVGLLLNFGARSLQFKRVYNLKHPDNKDYKSPPAK